ncbi:hypothetical protein VCR17J2_200001 [Vibrio coralliirubri]|nr:hypothetical protein VCR17J2_200001 [Vibrio coralliirubri]
MLSLRGCLVTIDAMGCQKDIVEKIVAQDADYLLTVEVIKNDWSKRLAKCLILVWLIVLTVINTSLKRKGMVVQERI